MTPIEILKMALSKEEAAIKLYDNLAKENQAVRDLLLTFKDEEYKHKNLLEKKIAEYTKY